MHGQGEDDAGTLRALLRGLRGERRQKDVAAAGGVSLSLYKKLESGRSCSTQIENLIRIARALGADWHQRASLIRLARPVLAPMIALLEEDGPGERPLESLTGLAGSLLEVATGREALRRAVERLHSALQVHGVAFALERGATGKMEVSFSVGALATGGGPHFDGNLPAKFPRGRLYAADHGPVRTVYAPIRDRGAPQLCWVSRSLRTLTSGLGVRSCLRRQLRFWRHGLPGWRRLHK